MASVWTWGRSLTDLEIPLLSFPRAFDPLLQPWEAKDQGWPPQRLKVTRGCRQPRAGVCLAPPRPSPGSHHAFWEWILNSRKALPGVRRVVNAFLAGGYRFLEGLFEGRTWLRTQFSEGQQVREK